MTDAFILGYNIQTLEFETMTLLVPRSEFTMHSIFNKKFSSRIVHHNKLRVVQVLLIIKIETEFT